MMNQTINIFGSNKELQRVLKKNDLILEGHFIRRHTENKTDLVHITNISQLEHIRPMMVSEGMEYYIEEKENYKTNKKMLQGVLCNPDGTMSYIKVFYVPKVRKFIKALNEELAKMPMTVGYVCEMFKNSFVFDLELIVNNIIPKVVNKYYNEEVSYLDGLTFYKKGDKVYHVDFQFTPMILNFINQEVFKASHYNHPVLFSTETANKLFEEFGEDHYIIDEYIGECGDKIYSLLGEPEYLKLKGSNIDWQGCSGVKYLRLGEGFELIQELIPEYDATVEVRYDYVEKELYVIRYSHDCPTGTTITFEVITEEEYEEER